MEDAQTGADVFYIFYGTYIWSINMGLFHWRRTFCMLLVVTAHITTT